MEKKPELGQSIVKVENGGKNYGIFGQKTEKAANLSPANNG
jgi:hypothetical protein